MDKIIRDEYDKHYAHYPISNDYNRRDLWNAFADGWEACEVWHEEQQAKDKDYASDCKEEARLAGGLG